MDGRSYHFRDAGSFFIICFLATLFFSKCSALYRRNSSKNNTGFVSVCRSVLGVYFRVEALDAIPRTLQAQS